MDNNYLPSRVRAFTIVELLLVIVLLVVVAVILFPVFVRPQRRQDPEINCMRNEKQLGLAVFQYVQDYDEKYPCGNHLSPSQTAPVGWAGQIYPYVKSASLFQCPNDPTSADSTNSYEVPISYAYNWNIGYIAPPTGYDAKTIPVVNPAKSSDFAFSSRTVEFCEVEGVTCDITDSHGKEASSPAVLGGSLVYLSSVDGSETSMRYATGVLHNDPASAAVVGTAAGNAIAADGIHEFASSNFLLADGHAKCLKPESISAGLSNNVSSDDCTAGQRLTPIGTAGPGYAAATGCPDSSLAGTFSIN